jgi:predicted TIM-barrel fold metal-dependent hydrolase
VRIIDIHSHFFSRPFFEALAAQAPGGDAVADRLDRLAAATGIEMPLPSVADHVARWTEALDEGGVEHMATFASLPDEIPAVAEAVRLAPDRLSGFALVNPRAGHSADDLREMLDRSGFRGVLLFPAMHHFHIAGAESERLLHVLEEHESTVFVHCGLLVVKLRDLLGLPRPYDLSYANPLDIIPAANRFRKVRFVIPHFGAGFFREALMAGTQCENIYVDTSSSNSWISTQPGLPDLREVLRRALEVFGPGRVLFGTDSNVFPAGWRRDRYESQLELLQSLGTSDEDLAAVFGGNAARLLGLDA